MELKEARYILSIYKNKTISKAAEELYISQPSLSKYLKNMEKQLGQPLFDRINNEYVPTFIGERYVHYAQRIVSSGLEWLHEFNDLTQQDIGRINLALPVMLGNTIIEPTLAHFYLQYPNVEINLMEEVHFVSEHFLEDHTVDLVLYNVPNPPDFLDYEILRKEEIVMIVSKKNPLAYLGEPREGFAHPWVDIKYFKDQSFIMLYPDQTTGGLAENLFKVNEIEPNILLRTRNSQLSIQLAIQNVGISFAPESYFNALNKDGQSVCLSVGDKPMYTTLIAGYLKNRYMPNYTKAYLELIKAYCRK